MDLEAIAKLERLHAGTLFLFLLFSLQHLCRIMGMI